MKRFIAAASFVLAVLFLFNSCTLFETPRAPSDTQTENGQPATGPAVTDPAATQPPATETEPAPYIPLSELYPDAIAFSDLKTSKNSVRYADWRRGVPSGDETVKALVILISFSDGYKVDRSLFEDRFNGVYDFDNCSLSVASYYNYASYGKIAFDFSFVYYESDMTCEEAWHYVHDEDENGHYRWNGFLYEVYEETKAENIAGIDYKTLDGNGDGYIDVTYFVTGEDTSKTVPGKTGYSIYGGGTAFTNYNEYRPDTEDPAPGQFIKTDYERIVQGSGNGAKDGPRVLLHETGHAFGLMDYYDVASTFDYPTLATVGQFDMMHADCGEHNSFSKFAMGFIEPYVAEDIEDEITIRMSVSEDHDDVILIPTSKGWNGSAFDEYILIDICAPIGAAGYDWGYNMRCEKANVQGGVRVYHVDARLTHYEKDPNTGEYGWVFIEDPTDAIKFEGVNVNEAFCNTLSAFPVINGKKQSNYYHLIEIISSAGTSHYRSGVGMGSIMIFDTSDLFAPGQTFRADNNHAFSFSGNSAVMNNGGSFDYSVSVLAYDPVVHEAVVTIKKLTTK